MKPHLRRVLMALWVFCLAAPFIYVGIDYDSQAHEIVARLRKDRLIFLIHDLPRLLVDRALGVTIAVAIIVGLFILAKRIHKSTWANRQVVFFSERRMLLGMIVLGCLVVLPCFLSDKFLGLAIFAGIYMILAMGLNLTVGMTGLLVLGYAAFYAIGAYTFGILYLRWGVPFYVAFLPAIAAGGLFGFLVGLPSIRLRGDYLAIVTLGFGETVRFLLKNLPALTNGDRGISIAAAAKIPTLAPCPLFPFARSGEQITYYLILALVVLSMWLVRNLVNSRLGRAWIAIREDETAARAMGINTVRMKVIAFMLSAMWAAVAGVLYVAREGYVEPDVFRFDESVLILSMVILGGMGSGPGPILGAAVLYVVPQVLRDEFPALLDYRLLIFCVVMIAMMIFRPQGLLGSVRRKIELETTDE
jgi:branched-chain amino acid transport system permease protein